MEAQSLAAENGLVFDVSFLRKIQRQIFEFKNEFNICAFLGQGCDERTTAKRFFSVKFSDVLYKWPLEAYGMRGRYGRNGSIREEWKLMGCVEA